MVLDDTCLFRGLGNPKLCEPTSSAYIAMHGMSGNGGRLGDSAVPADYRGLLLADIDQPEKLMKTLTTYAESFDKQFGDVRSEHAEAGKTRDEIQLKNLYLWSESPGTGKTTIALALLQEYLLRNFLGHIRRGQTPPLRPTYFLDVNEWQTDYNQFNRPKVPEAVAEAAAARFYRNRDRAKDAEFLVMDDIGVRDSTDGFRGDLHTVINYRVANELPTVYTSNVPISELEEIFGEKRLPDRIREMTKPIPIAGTSRRGMKR